ncbi:hypothetical protein ABB33_17685, partial [Stenotrophomonas acidaminiphila]
ALYQAIVGQWLVSVPMTIIMIVAGFLFVSVSGYLAGLVGSSNNPVSGITIATILFASVVLLLLLGDDGKVQVGGAPPTCTLPSSPSSISSITEANRMVAMVMPETGLLDEPTRPAR